MRKLPVFFSPEEARRLVAAVPAPARRNRLMLMLMMLTGVRVSELIHLKIEHIDFSARQLLVVCGKGAKDRMIPLNKKLLDPLRQWIGARTNGWLFPSARTNGPITTRNVEYMVKAAGKKANILKWAKPHSCRHTAASQLLARGANLVEIMQILGHSNLATTQKYLWISTDSLKAAIDRL